MSIRIEADLRFQVQSAAVSGRAVPVHGSIRADGAVVDVELSRTPSLARGARETARPLADLLYRNGLTVRLSGPSGLLAEAGVVDAPRWHRVFTGTPRIRLGSARVLVGSVRGPQLFDAVLPSLPPSPGRSPGDAPRGRIRAAAAAVGRVLERLRNR